MSKKYADEDDDRKVKQKQEKDIYTTEYASGTCFSDEQETKFKSKQQKQGIFTRTINKVKEGFPKLLMPPQTIQQYEAGKSSRWGDLIQRTKWTFLMLIGFMLFILLGNFYCAVLVLLIIMAIYNELLDLAIYRDRNNEVKNYYLISWYFFFLCIYYFYIKLLMDKLIYLNKFKVLSYILKYHNLGCFMLYMIGFLLFIISLTKGYYKYQFRSFAWIHINLCIFGISSALIMANLFNGLVWFILPCILVIGNDISAYIFGRMFGKTPLSSLSPKKTVEGFIGALFCTMFLGYLFSELLLHFDFLLCPIKEITWQPFFKPECDPTDLRRDYILSYDFPLFAWNVTIPLKRLHFHTFFLGLFASLLAPLGGLFASGFKRAIKIKDFANLIPGHGGLTDRMDCQILMGFFTYIWTSQFLFYSEQRKINSIISSIISLNYEDQMKIFTYLNQSLGTGMVNAPNI